MLGRREEDLVSDDGVDERGDEGEFENEQPEGLLEDAGDRNVALEADRVLGIAIDCMVKTGFRAVCRRCWKKGTNSKSRMKMESNKHRVFNRWKARGVGGLTQMASRLPNSQADLVTSKRKCISGERGMRARWRHQIQYGSLM